jgi:hypothetical protein
MWECLHCGEKVEEVFDVCWKCQANRDGSPSELPDPLRDEAEEEELALLNELYPAPVEEEQDAGDEEEVNPPGSGRAPRKCLRCQGPLKYAGTRELHEGTDSDFINDPDVLHINHLTLQVYICPACLHVELFATDTRP